MGMIPAEIMNILSDRKISAEVACANRIKALHERYPELREADIQIRIQTAERMMALLQSGDDTEATAELHRLEEQRNEIIERNSIPEDYDRPASFCSACGDEGFIDGKECRCLRRLLIPLYREHSGLNRYPGVSFSDSTDALYSVPDKIKPIFEFCRLYVAMDPGDRPNLLFWGNPGTGMTCLAVCTARAILGNAEPVLVIRSSELIETMDEYRTLKRSFNPNTERDAVISSLRDRILGVDFLVIDELGVEAKGPYNTADLLHILGERRQNNRATLITTNLSLAELGRHYDSRLHSRLIGDYRIFHFEGEDIRTRDEYRKSGGGRIRP